MKDANGFYLDILQSNAGTSIDTVGIRMNVDDFDAACELLRQHGFTNAFGDDTVATKSSKAAMMVSPSGFASASYSTSRTMTEETDRRILP